LLALPTGLIGIEVLGVRVSVGVVGHFVKAIV
jgi:hypothetical protein